MALPQTAAMSQYSLYGVPQYANPQYATSQLAATAPQDYNREDATFIRCTTRIVFTIQSCI